MVEDREDRSGRLRVAVTGVSRGCGRALAVELAAAGHEVHGCARDRSKLEELARTLGPGHTFQAVDVTDAAAVRAWAKTISAHGSGPDLVVNNAGLINSSAPLWEVNSSQLAAVVDVNVKGTAYVMQAFLPAMVAAQRGAIANFSSGWGRSVAPGVAPYCATKWAVEGLSLATAGEVPQGVAVVAVNPGIIHTEMLESCFGDDAGAYDDPGAWARRAAPFLLALGAPDNGSRVTIP